MCIGVHICRISPENSSSTPAGLPIASFGHYNENACPLEFLVFFCIKSLPYLTLLKFYSNILYIGLSLIESEIRNILLNSNLIFLIELIFMFFSKFSPFPSRIFPVIALIVNALKSARIAAILFQGEQLLLSEFYYH